MSQPSANQGRKIRAMIGIIEEVYKHYPRMELSQLRVLLRVLEKPGIRAAELVDITGLSKSSLSRAVRVLGSDPYLDDGGGGLKQGLNLITQVTDPLDGRAKLIAPTRIGRRIGDVIDQTIGELCDS